MVDILGSLLIFKVKYMTIAQIIILIILALGIIGPYMLIVLNRDPAFYATLWFFTSTILFVCLLVSIDYNNSRDKKEQYKEVTFKLYKKIE